MSQPKGRGDSVKPGFADRLKEAKADYEKKYGLDELNDTDFADLLELSKQQVWLYLNGHRDNPSLVLVLKIARKLEADPYYLALAEKGAPVKRDELKQVLTRLHDEIIVRVNEAFAVARGSPQGGKLTGDLRVDMERKGKSGRANTTKARIRKKQ